MTIAVPDEYEQAAPLRVTPETYASLKASLCAEDNPLSKRFRALFTLKSLKSNEAVDIIALAFKDPSALLKHELAYVLGQMRNPHAIEHLAAVLRDQAQEPMVRHEAAEALGAIGDPAALDILRPFLKDDLAVVRETVELAVDRIEYEMRKAANGGVADEDASAYASVDPAPAVKHAHLTTEQLKASLLDASLPLFERYRAMFALRNRGSEDAVLALAEGFGDSSALFRHEIAYVFGQMQHPASVPSLVSVLSNTAEEGMVRHEAAEALGSIATPECFPVLRRFVNDSERVVRESCVIGLDMYEHETSGAFQYAEPLKQ
ncbi:deoxyhypusine hydroxylase [Polyrhizophydium stewartii]|uniref:Deoxyhypusine hydroxylase n=1 Tax=Polyrhizophydium stewartii TaxID=2732419 RepID=A0ABR4NHJ5_9FUNG|nr:deoxyhypusine hydroxylase [Polyrhizophydium stewartii]